MLLSQKEGGREQTHLIKLSLNNCSYTLIMVFFSSIMNKYQLFLPMYIYHSIHICACVIKHTHLALLILHNQSLIPLVQLCLNTTISSLSLYKCVQGAEYHFLHVDFFKASLSLPLLVIYTCVDIFKHVTTTLLLG